MWIKQLAKTLRARREREKLYCTADYWDAKAIELEGDAISMWANNHLNAYYHQEVLSLLQKYLDNIEGAKALDVGCGTGRISRYLVGRGATVLGIDFAAQAIAIAQKQTLSGNPTYRLQSVFDLEDKNEFDFVFSWGVLAVACRNRAELLDVLLRLRKSLKPRGKVLFLEPIHRGFLHRVLNMDVAEFCQTMDEAGFEIADVRHLHFWPTRLLLAYLQWPKAITAAGYSLGEWMLGLLRHRTLGDYQAIYAWPKG